MSITDDTPTKLVRQRIHAALAHAHGAHAKAATAAATAYAVPAAPPADAHSLPVKSTGAGGAV